MILYIPYFINLVMELLLARIGLIVPFSSLVASLIFILVHAIFQKSRYKYIFISLWLFKIVLEFMLIALSVNWEVRVTIVSFMYSVIMFFILLSVILGKHFFEFNIVRFKKTFKVIAVILLVVLIIDFFLIIRVLIYIIENPL